MQLLRLSDVTKLTGLSRATIYRLMKEGRFPSSKRLSKRAVAWAASDMHAWAKAAGDKFIHRCACGIDYQNDVNL